MLKDDEHVGALVVYRREARPFSEKQIGLLTNLAAQAVIAIENARLLGELRQRTDELWRSVGELKALGEVSQAVNSTLDLETVWQPSSPRRYSFPARTPEPSTCSTSGSANSICAPLTA